jgi:hypothetical protein
MESQQFTGLLWTSWSLKRMVVSSNDPGNQPIHCRTGPIYLAALRFRPGSPVLHTHLIVIFRPIVGLLIFEFPSFGAVVTLLRFSLAPIRRSKTAI